MAAPPDFTQLVRVFTRIGCLSFGGPAGQIALMHSELVEERQWVSEAEYLHALNFCHLLPGPEAQQLATYIGWKLHGVRGGLAAGLLFVIPGALVILALSILYSYAARLGLVAALFAGVKAAVLAIIIQALLRIAGRALDTSLKKALAALAFVGLFIFNLPFPLIIAAAAVVGALAPASALNLKPSGVEPLEALPAKSIWMATTRTILAWLVIWIAPMALVLVALGKGHVLWDIGLYFSQLAVVTFGGAYAVLAYMAQTAVQHFGWLNAGEMADGLGLAETTPGPLIMVTQFVGFLAAFRDPGGMSPLVAGLLGAGLTSWVTFAPCFLWIFVLAPWIERLQHATRLKGALSAVTASVVGVIANLTLWFGLHVLFSVLTTYRIETASFIMPDLASLDIKALALFVVAALLLFWRRLGVIPVLGAITLLSFLAFALKL